ncbi:hypothetical protein BJ875DRAFT_525036 [Amylocarpus encephaloides]|uniref:Fido domain-containing protein n=1 Tax=Amylocarpus encephaloides TaxID=45428 RepID=A0A9P8C0I1_9HELO|nr:hypothetical protein BJ875DRAFT_525036 [Amylocarpus encephaloides]
MASKALFTAPKNVPGGMKIFTQDFIQDIRDRQNTKSLVPFYLAADVCQDLVTIHPSRDGNGRMGRLIANAFLIKDARVVISTRRRRRIGRSTGGSQPGLKTRSLKRRQEGVWRLSFSRRATLNCRLYTRNCGRLRIDDLGARSVRIPLGKGIESTSESCPTRRHQDQPLFFQLSF